MTTRPLPPLSEDDDATRRRRRLRAITRDVELHIAGTACPRCGQRSRLDDGNGCRCEVGPMLADRCAGLAAGRCYCEAAS